MEEKQTKKTKKSKTKKDIKAKLEKPISKVEDDIDKIIFPSFKTDVNNAQQYIIDCFGAQGERYLVMGKYIPFMFHDKFLYDANVHAEIKSYINDIKRRLIIALGINKKLKLLDDIMETIDAPSLEQQARQADWKSHLPRYKKYKRLEKMYDVLIQFTLKLIHTFYWFDFKNFIFIDNGRYTKEDKSANVLTLNDYVNNLLPIMLKFKDELEKEVDKEYPVDILETGAGLY